MDPRLAATLLQDDVERFLYQEARFLDEGRFEEWLALFTDDAKYWAPTRESRARREDEVRREGELPLFEDDKRFMTARVQRLATGLAHAEQPASRTRHFVSNVEVEPREGPEVDVRSNILVYQSRLERTESVFVGSRQDRLRKVDGGWRIVRRKVVLDQTLLPRALSIFF